MISSVVRPEIRLPALIISSPRDFTFTPAIPASSAAVSMSTIVVVADFRTNVSLQIPHRRSPAIFGGISTLLSWKSFVKIVDVEPSGKFINVIGSFVEAGPIL